MRVCKSRVWLHGECKAAQPAFAFAKPLARVALAPSRDLGYEGVQLSLIAGAGALVNDSSDDPVKGEKRAPGPKSREKRDRNSPPDDAFDIWLDRSLRKMFEDAEKEPIPPDLLALIKRHQEKD